MQNINSNYEYLISEIVAKQDYKKIYENILNGHYYAEYNISLENTKNNIPYKDENGNIIKDVVKIKFDKTIRNIPEFKKDSIFLEIEGDNFFNNMYDIYSQTNILKILEIAKYSREGVYIDLNITVNNIKNNQEIINLNKKTIEVKSSKTRKELIKNYHTIFNFLKENHSNIISSSNCYQLNFNSKKNTINLRKVLNNQALNSLGIIFNIEENIKELNTVYPFSILRIKKNVHTYAIDIDKSLEIIELFKNIENF